MNPISFSRLARGAARQRVRSVLVHAVPGTLGKQLLPHPTHTRQRSNFASQASPDKVDWLASAAATLCAVNCTVLPALTAALPVLGSLAPPGLEAAAHEVVMYSSLGLVLPFGAWSLARLHKAHGQGVLTAAGFTGMGVIAAVHLPCAIAAMPCLVPHSLHAPAAISGAALLLGAQYAGRKASPQPTCCGSGSPAPAPDKREGTATGDKDS